MNASWQRMAASLKRLRHPASLLPWKTATSTVANECRRPRRLNILYLSCHGVLEWDDLRMFTASSHRVFSLGDYSHPAVPGVKFRPGLQSFFHEGDWDAFTKSGSMLADRLVTREFARNFDVVIVNHFVDWIVRNLDAFGDMPIVYRSLGQSTRATERELDPLVGRVSIVRYSKRELGLPGFHEPAACIYFGKYKSDFMPWNGSNRVIAFCHDYVARPQAVPSINIFERITENWFTDIYGRGNEDLAASRGLVPADEQAGLYRDAGLYVHVHSAPASYSLSLMEAMAVGVPILAPTSAMVRNSIDPDFANHTAFTPGRYEVDALLGLNPALLYSSVEEARSKGKALLHDSDMSRAVSADLRKSFADHFDARRIAGQWDAFLHRLCA